MASLYDRVRYLLRRQQTLIGEEVRMVVGDEEELGKVC